MPDSPVISTVLLVGAIVSTISNTCSIALLLPMMLANWLRRVHRPLEQDVLLLQALALELLADAEAQDLGVERLLDVVVDAELRDASTAVSVEPNAVIMIAITDGSMLLRCAQHLDAVDLRHPDVGDQEVERLAASSSSIAACAVLGDEHVVPVALQQDRQHLAHRALVVDDEDARGLADGWRPRSVVTVPAMSGVPPRSVGDRPLVRGVGCRMRQRDLARCVPSPCCDVTWTSPP